MGKGYSPEQIVRKLRQAESKLTSGSTVAEVARELGISEALLTTAAGFVIEDACVVAGKGYGSTTSSSPRRRREAAA